MTENTADTITITTEMPVAVTYDRSTGRFTVEVELCGMRHAIMDSCDGDDTDQISGEDAEELFDAWCDRSNGNYATARADVQFVAP